MNIPVSPDEYRTKLLKRILLAGSQEEVKRSIDEAMLALEASRVHGHAILRFVEIIISELELYSPMKKDAQQWSNITLSRILFKRIKDQLTATVN